MKGAVGVAFYEQQPLAFQQRIGVHEHLPPIAFQIGQSGSCGAGIQGTFAIVELPPKLGALVTIRKTSLQVGDRRPQSSQLLPSAIDAGVIRRAELGRRNQQQDHEGNENVSFCDHDRSFPFRCKGPDLCFAYVAPVAAANAA